MTCTEKTIMLALLLLPYGTAYAGSTTTIDGLTTGDDITLYGDTSYRGGDSRGNISYLKDADSSENILILDNNGQDSFNKQLAAALREGGSSHLLNKNKIDIRDGAVFSNSNVLVGAYLQNGSGVVSNNSIEAQALTGAKQLIAGQIHNSIGEADANLVTGNKIVLNLDEKEHGPISGQDNNGNDRYYTEVLMAGLFTGSGNGHVNGNRIEITGGLLTKGDAAILAAEHQGSGVGNANRNSVVLNNCTTAATVYAASRYNGSGDLCDNSVTLNGGKVEGVRVASHRGTGGKVMNNTLTVKDTDLGWAHTAFVSGGHFSEVSGNSLIMEGNAVSRDEVLAVCLTSSKETTVDKVCNNTVILRDNANIINMFLAPYSLSGKGTVIESGDNKLILDENWRGEGSKVDPCTPNSLNKVMYFDQIEIGWSDGKTLDIKNFEANATSGGGDITFIVNDVNTKVNVSELKNDAEKAVAVEATGRVRDQMGDDRELAENLQKLASSVSVEKENGVDAPQVTESVKVQEGDVHGSVSAEIDTTGQVMEGSVVKKANTVNESLNNMSGIQYMAFRSQMNDLQKRLRALRAQPGTRDNGCWARTFAGKDKYTSLGSDYRYNGLQFGTDRRIGRCIAGLALGYTDAETRRHNGKADDKQYHVGAYAGWQGSKGDFVDLVAKFNRFDSEHELVATNGDMSTSGQNTWGASLTAEYGRHIVLQDSGFYLEPHVGAMYGHLDGTSFMTSRGVRVRQDSAEALIGKAGLTVGYTFTRIRGSVYARAELLHDWGGETEQTMSKARATKSIGHDLSDTYGEFAIGGTCGLTENAYLFAEVQTTTGDHIEQPWHVNFGISQGF